jgi:hypothetical protein
MPSFFIGGGGGGGSKYAYLSTSTGGSPDLEFSAHCKANISKKIINKQKINSNWRSLHGHHKQWMTNMIDKINLIESKEKSHQTI